MAGVRLLSPEPHPCIVVLSSLFPSSAQPTAGVFIRERMFRVARVLPLTVVSPRPWFPLQALIRRWRPHFRPSAARRETHQGVEILRPRFFCFPAMLKRLDGFLMAVAAWPVLRRLQRVGRLDIIDAHFGYPDGYAAALLGRWLRVPVTITLRGTEVRLANDPVLRPLLDRALRAAHRVFSVSTSLKQVAIGLGIPPDHVQVIGNGVDAGLFYPLERTAARRLLGIAADAPVLVSVGGLVERKGFHRVIDCLPQLRRMHPDLIYLIVGGPSPEGDWTDRLKQQVTELGLQDCVRFLGPLPPAELRKPLSAADVFVLATRNEGWANVFLEAMACGLPVVTTDVGGNAEVVCRADLGTIVPFGDHDTLCAELAAAMRKDWNRAAIRAHAQENAWERRIETLVGEFRTIWQETQKHRRTVLPAPEAQRS